MEFNEGLPKVHGKSTILTVIDRFSQYVHFIALGHLYSAALVAYAFFKDIVHLHDFLTSIVSDCDLVFVRYMWRDLFKMDDVKLRLSMAFHFQMDGLLEPINKVIAMYLHCATWDQSCAWVNWLLWQNIAWPTSCGG